MPLVRHRFNRAAPPAGRPPAPLAWWRDRGARVWRLWAVGLVASVLVTTASAYGYLERLGLQKLSFDLLLMLREQRFPPEVVVVAIDEQAWDTIGRRQPISRKYLARVLRGLERAGAAAVGLDVSLSSPSTPAEDGELVDTIRSFSDNGVSRVVLVFGEPPRTGPLADPVLYEHVVRGAGEVPIDRDAVIRRMTPLVPWPVARPTTFAPALGVAVAARLAGLDQAGLKVLLPPEGGRVPLGMTDDAGGWIRLPVVIGPADVWRINFAGRARSLLNIPSDAVAALSDPSMEVATDNPLRGRVAFVGATFSDSRDTFDTPFGPMPGVEIHATIAHMIVTRSFIRPSGWLTSFAVQAASVLAAGVIMVVARPMVGTLICLVGGVVIGIPASYFAFQRSGYWMDFLLPVLVTSMLGMGAEIMARRRIRNSFGRYLSPQVAKQVYTDASSLRGERREVSILFSDLRGFTTLSETMPAEKVAERLNEYFDAVTPPVFEHRGMVNDFVGDGIIAFFGAPLPDPEHAWHAVQAADGMRHALNQLNERWGAAGLPTLRMGIGVHSGQVFLGDIGGRRRAKITVVGDSVNLASRVEGLNKELGTTILITEETRSTIGGRAETTDHGLHSVKGRSQPVHVHELLAATEPTHTGGS